MALPENPYEGDTGYKDGKKYIYVYGRWMPYDEWLKDQQKSNEPSIDKKSRKFKKALKKIWTFPGTAPAYGETPEKWRKNKDRKQEDWGEIGD